VSAIVQKLGARLAVPATRTLGRAARAITTIRGSYPGITGQFLRLAVGNTVLPHPDSIAKSGAILFSELTRDITGAANQTAWYMDTRAKLERKETITRVIVNFPLCATNSKYGHPGGDAFLAALFSAVASFLSSEYPGQQIGVYRRGPNFEIDIPSFVDVRSFMARLYKNLDGRRIGFEFSKKENTPKKKGSSVVFPNIGAWHYDPKEHSGPASVGELRTASAICSSRLNRQPAEQRGSFSVDAYNEVLVKNYSAESRAPAEKKVRSRRIIDTPEWKPYLDILRKKIREALSWAGVKGVSQELVNEIIRLKYVEPDSGLPNINAFDLIGPALGTSSIGFFDGNKIGAFVRSFGFLGDSMVDIIISRRISSAAATVLAKRGIILFRTGPGSEEFWVLGKVKKEEMLDALEEFTEQVNRPLRFNIKVSELKAAKEGQDYLRNNFPADLTDEDEVIIDLCKIKRQERFSQITFTGAAREMNPLAAEDARRHFYFHKKRVEEAGERAKEVNFDRVGFIMTVDPYGGYNYPGHEDSFLVKAAEALSFLYTFIPLSDILGPLYLWSLKQASLK